MGNQDTALDRNQAIIDNDLRMTAILEEHAKLMESAPVPSDKQLAESQALLDEHKKLLDDNSVLNDANMEQVNNNLVSMGNLMDEHKAINFKDGATEAELMESEELLAKHDALSAENDKILSDPDATPEVANSVTDQIVTMGEPNPNLGTIGEKVNSNYEEAQRILEEYKNLKLGENSSKEQLEQGDRLLAESGALITENKALSENGGFSKEITPEMQSKVSEYIEKAPDMSEKMQQAEIGKHKYLLFMQDLTGMDLSDPNDKFDIFDIFNAVVALAEPGAMDKVMDKMKKAASNLQGNATPEEKLDAAKGAAEETIEDINQEQEQKQEQNNENTAPENDEDPTVAENTGLSGVNGTAVTYKVDIPVGAVEISKIKPDIQEGTSLITAAFTVHANAKGTMVDATIDPNLPAANEETFDIAQAPPPQDNNAHAFN